MMSGMVDVWHPIAERKVLDFGWVELWGYMGEDNMPAAAARVSLRRELLSKAWSDESYQRDTGLINRLMRDRHTSPFEQIVFQWRVRAPLVVGRQWWRHRFSSLNEESGRYVALEDEFYTPDHVRKQNGKAMDYNFTNMEPALAESLIAKIRAHNEASRDLYEELQYAGMAREQARMVLPTTQYTTALWTCNGLALMNFLHKRNHPAAQWEIRQYAAAMEDIFKSTHPRTHAAFREFWGEGDGMVDG